MNKDELLKLLESVKDGHITPKKARQRILISYKYINNYSDYLSLTLDGMPPEEAARECHLL